MWPSIDVTTGGQAGKCSSKGYETCKWAWVVKVTASIQPQRLKWKIDVGWHYCTWQYVYSHPGKALAKHKSVFSMHYLYCLYLRMDIFYPASQCLVRTQRFDKVLKVENSSLTALGFHFSSGLRGYSQAMDHMFSHWDTLKRTIYVVYQIFRLCGHWRIHPKIITSASDLYSPQLLTLKPFPACIVSLGSRSSSVVPL